MGDVDVPGVSENQDRRRKKYDIPADPINIELRAGEGNGQLTRIRSVRPRRTDERISKIVHGGDLLLHGLKLGDHKASMSI